MRELSALSSQPVVRWRRRWAVAMVMVLVLLAAGGVRAQDDQIVAVEIRSEGLSSDRDIEGILGLEVGEPLDRRRIRRGIQILMAAGEFSWIRVRTDPEGAGIKVTVEIDLHPRLGALKVEVPSMLWEIRVRRWLDIEVGDPVNPDRFESAARRIRRRIESLGYPDVEVNPYLSLNRGSHEVSATLEVVPGDRAVLAGLEIDGLSEGRDPEAFMPKGGVGKKLTEAAVDDIRDTIERKMRLAGFWEAKAVSIERTGPAGKSVLKIEVEEGPLYTLELKAPEGMEEIALEAIPDVAEEDLNPAQTDALAETIVERLQEQGYPLAKVTALLELKKETTAVLKVEFVPGPKIAVGEVGFPGSDRIEARRLAKAISIKKGAGKARKPLTAKRKEMDRRTLEDLYRREGFQDVRISDPVMTQTEDGELRVEFPIDEGLRWSVDSFRVEGVPAEALGLTDDDSYQLEVTDPWNPGDLDYLVERWTRAMADVGYPEARVTADVGTPEAGRVAVVLVVQPGPFVRLGRVMIAGLTTTRTSVVKQILRVAGLKEGTAYSQKTINRAQQELYRLGLFRRVTIAPIPGQERRVDRGVVVRLEEGLQRSYLVGLGWGTEDRFRVTLGWSHLNLFGGGHALSLETRYSSREFRYQIGLREPLLPWVNQPGYSALYRTEEIFSDWDQLRYGVWFEVGDRLKVPFRHWIRYEYQVVEPNAPDDILSELERENQQIELSSITVPLEWDYRNDMLSPTSGFLITLAPEYAFPLFSAEVEFFKIRAGVSQYIETSFGRINWAIRVGATRVANLDPEEPANLQIPLASRFFAGGANTHRAFKTDRLGIPGETLGEDGTAIGGNAVVLVNAEFAKPIWGALNAVFFVDGGNVWIKPADINLGDFRWGVGAGLRFETPAGPFRLEYGHKLDRLEGESSGEFYFSFGMTF
jgi:outer membrane protein assembly complex protein YaeT